VPNIYPHHYIYAITFRCTAHHAPTAPLTGAWLPLPIPTYPATRGCPHHRASLRALAFAFGADAVRALRCLLRTARGWTGLVSSPARTKTHRYLPHHYRTGVRSPRAGWVGRSTTSLVNSSEGRVAYAYLVSRTPTTTVRGDSSARADDIPVLCCVFPTSCAVEPLHSPAYHYLYVTGRLRHTTYHYCLLFSAQPLNTVAARLRVVMGAVRLLAAGTVATYPAMGIATGADCRRTRPPAAPAVAYDAVYAFKRATTDASVSAFTLPPLRAMDTS